MSDKYHHGNLKSELIEQGLRIINEEGEDKLSFRKVAAACSVSHTAAYAHFTDKEDMIKAIKETVVKQFEDELEKAVIKTKKSESKKTTLSEEKIIALGRAYVSFFAKKPDYFKFIFGNQIVNAHFDVTKEYSEDFPAFNLLKRLYKEMNKDLNTKKTNKEQQIELISLWSSVHGLASIVCMENAVYDCSVKKIIQECIN